MSALCVLPEVDSSYANMARAMAFFNCRSICAWALKLGFIAQLTRVPRNAPGGEDAGRGPLVDNFGRFRKF